MQAAPRRGSCGWPPPAFSISILVLLFIGRTFNNYYLVWPVTGAVAAALTWLGAGAFCRFGFFCFFSFFCAAFGSSPYRKLRPVR